MDSIDAQRISKPSTNSITYRIGWKLLTYFFFLLSILYLVVFIRAENKNVLFFCTETGKAIFTAILLLGYSYNRKIFSRAIWFSILAVVTVLDLKNNFEFFAKDVELSLRYSISLFVPLTLTALRYLAYYLYLFKSPDLWKESNEEER